VGAGKGVWTGATKYFGVPRPGLRGTTPGGMATGAPTLFTGADAFRAGLGAAAMDAAGLADACDGAALTAGGGLADGGVIFAGAGFCAADFLAPVTTGAGRVAGFFAAGAFAGVLAAGALAAGAFAAFALAAGFPGRTGAAFFATAFWVFFLAADVVTVCPRDGDAILGEKARRGRGSRFGRRGL